MKTKEYCIWCGLICNNPKPIVKAGNIQFCGLRCSIEYKRYYLTQKLYSD